MTQGEALLLLHEAAAEPHGMLLQCNNPKLLQQKLYAARRAAMDPELDVLQLRLVEHPEGNLAITKGSGKKKEKAA